MWTDEDLTEIRIKKVLGPTNSGTAVLLGNDAKTFVMFIGIYEGAALVRELNQEEPARPLTHELMTSIFRGFSLEIKRIVISEIVDNTFRATLIMEQRCVNEAGDWNGRRNEVHVDARPSDCLVLSLKEKKKLFATAAVLDEVRDISEELDISTVMPPGPISASSAKDLFKLDDLDVTGLQDLPGLFGGGDEDDDEDDD